MLLNSSCATNKKPENPIPDLYFPRCPILPEVVYLDSELRPVVDEDTPIEKFVCDYWYLVQLADFFQAYRETRAFYNAIKNGYTPSLTE